MKREKRGSLVSRRWTIDRSYADTHYKKLTIHYNLSQPAGLPSIANRPVWTLAAQVHFPLNIFLYHFETRRHHAPCGGLFCKEIRRKQEISFVLIMSESCHSSLDATHSSSFVTDVIIATTTNSNAIPHHRRKRLRENRRISRARKFNG